MIFKAKLGVNLQASLEHAIQNEMCIPADAKQGALFAHIHNALVIALQDEQDLVQELVELPESGNGVMEFLHLQKMFSGQTVARDVMNINSIVNTSLHTDIVTQAKKMISTNGLMQHKFSQELMVTMILSKLPAEFATIRDIIVERNELPSCNILIQKIEQHLSMNPTIEAPLRAFMTGGKPFHCHNCDKVNAHPVGKCNEPAVGCEYCGPQAWHMKKFCWVSNDKPLPHFWSDMRKEQMENKRKEYKEKLADKASSLFMTSEPSLSQMWKLVEGTSETRLSF
jgi:hypothetical protein